MTALPPDRTIVHLHGTARGIIQHDAEATDLYHKPGHLAPLEFFLRDPDGLLVTLGYSANDTDVRGLVDSMKGEVLTDVVITARKPPDGTGIPMSCFHAGGHAPSYYLFDTFSGFRRLIADAVGINLPFGEQREEKASPNWRSKLDTWAQGLPVHGARKSLQRLREWTDRSREEPHGSLTISLSDGVDVRFTEGTVSLLPAGAVPASINLLDATSNRGVADWVFLCRHVLEIAAIRGEERREASKWLRTTELCSDGERELARYAEIYHGLEKEGFAGDSREGVQDFAENLRALLTRHDVLHSIVRGARGTSPGEDEISD